MTSVKLVKTDKDKKYNTKFIVEIDISDCENMVDEIIKELNNFTWTFVRDIAKIIKNE